MELYCASMCLCAVQWNCYHLNNRLMQRARPGLIKKINRSKKPFGGRVRHCNYTLLYWLDVLGESFLFLGCVSETWIKGLSIV